ncbi:MAG TPA: hypothetical protein VF590_00575 [Isosphaeraceae bacterium]|jgi:hypothetical protein
MAQNTLQGFAWFIRPDPRRSPFETRPTYVWPLATGEPGVHNTFGPSAFLVVTESPEPPRVEAGWEVEPAALDSDFDAPGVRLIRAAGGPEAATGPAREYVFEIAGA